MKHFMIEEKLNYFYLSNLTTGFLRPAFGCPVKLLNLDNKARVLDQEPYNSFLSRTSQIDKLIIYCTTLTENEPLALNEPCKAIFS